MRSSVLSAKAFVLVFVGVLIFAGLAGFVDAKNFETSQKLNFLRLPYGK